jgi:2-octaprenylphenol hydroxylase
VTDTDGSVIILGGGLTGLVCARLLGALLQPQRPGLRVVVVDVAAAPTAPAADAALDLRVIALSPAALAVLAACGGAPSPGSPRLGHCRRMVVWREGADPATGGIQFDAAEFGRAELMTVVEADRLRADLWAACAIAPGIELVGGDAPAAVSLAADAVTVTLASGRRLTADLVVGAEGQDSWLREQLGVPKTARSYGQSALVAHVGGAVPHGDTAWQCFLPQGPLALLPLGDGRSSIVWSTAPERAAELQRLDATDFEHALTAASGGVRGALTLTTPRVAFPLAAHHARQYTGRRWALVGDAAHRIHPLAGQGANLGLLDAAALAEALATHGAQVGADLGDPRALRHYERWRKGANLTTLAVMDALHRLFTSELPGVRAGAGRALALADRSLWLKRLLAGHAMGIEGDLPQAARAS